MSADVDAELGVDRGVDADDLGNVGDAGDVEVERMVECDTADVEVGVSWAVVVTVAVTVGLTPEGVKPKLF